MNAITRKEVRALTDEELEGVSGAMVAMWYFTPDIAMVIVANETSHAWFYASNTYPG